MFPGEFLEKLCCEGLEARVKVLVWYPESLPVFLPVRLVELMKPPRSQAACVPWTSGIKSTKGALGGGRDRAVGLVPSDTS